jgi:hypothetical protein
VSALTALGVSTAVVRASLGLGTMSNLRGTALTSSSPKRVFTDSPALH